VVVVIKRAGRAFTGGPLFCAWLIGPALLLFSASVFADNPCALPDNAAREWVDVERVTDGDTIVLTDRRRVRVIGINSPELSKPSERKLKAEAEAAREIASELIQSSDRVQLVHGDEAFDRHGRTLAHVLFSDGSSLASELILRGLAAATAVSPNTRCAAHHRALELNAREERRGLWQHADNPWHATADDKRRLAGFHILTDQVVNVKQTKRNWRLQLSGGAIVNGTKSLMSESEWQALANQTITVRGWFGQQNGKPIVRLHHLANLHRQPQ